MNSTPNQIPTYAKTLEESLVNAMQYTKRYPLDIIYMYPGDGNDELMQLFEEGYGVVVGSPNVTNRPTIFHDAIDEAEDLRSIEDCKNQARKIKEYCAEKGFDNINNGFGFTFGSTREKIVDNEFIMDLLLNTTESKVAHMIDSFNKSCSELNAVSNLKLTDGFLRGSVKLLRENG